MSPGRSQAVMMLRGVMIVMVVVMALRVAPGPRLLAFGAGLVLAASNDAGSRKDSRRGASGG